MEALSGMQNKKQNKTKPQGSSLALFLYPWVTSLHFSHSHVFQGLPNKM